MFLLSSSMMLAACGGADPTVPAPDPKPATEQPAPAAADPAAAELPALEVTLEDNHKTCFGDADCMPLQLDCCCGGTVVAVNKGSADAVKGKFSRPAAECAGTPCEEGCPEAVATCVEFKCALAK